MEISIKTITMAEFGKKLSDIAIELEFELGNKVLNSLNISDIKLIEFTFLCLPRVDQNLRETEGIRRQGTAIAFVKLLDYGLLDQSIQKIKRELLICISDSLMNSRTRKISREDKICLSDSIKLLAVSLDID